MRGFSIKTRLIYSLVAATVGLYALTALGVYSFVATMVWQQFDEALRNELRDFMPETRVASDGSIHAEYHEMKLPRFGGRDGEAYYQVWNRKQESILKSASLPPDYDLPRAGLGLNEIAIVSAKLPGGYRGRIASVFMVPAGETDDSNARSERVFLAVGHTDVDVRSTLSKLASAQVVAGVLLALCGVLTIRRVVERSCRPLSRFASIAARLDSENLGDRLPDTTAPEEVRPFLVQLNSMLDRVEAGFDRERRFSASVAHELRTPIAELRSLMEVALTEGGDDLLREDPAEVYREGAEIAERMGKLVDSLSNLLRARAETCLERDALVDVEIGSILRSAIESQRRDAEERAIEIEAEFEEQAPLAVTADPVLLRALLDNLLSNGIGHAPGGSVVLVRANSVDERWLELSVVNEKGDLEEADLGFMAEPFWQKDAARSERNRLGLGLALATSYVKLLNSGLIMELRKEQFVVTFRLPIAKGPSPVARPSNSGRREVAVS